MWIQYNPNPTERNVEDCAVRAVAKALDTDWENAYALIVANGYQMGDMPHSNAVVSIAHPCQIHAHIATLLMTLAETIQKGSMFLDSVGT